MAMPKMPKASPAAVERFESLLPSGPEVTVKNMFGQPAAFVAGHMFMGVFGAQVFVRLSEEDLASVAKIPGVRPFEPMPGRPMRAYAVLPEALLLKPGAAAPWVKKSIAYARGLPPKTNGARKLKRHRSS
jgi:TfoX/Sxy family transcriptional regulator of competence genes